MTSTIMTMFAAASLIAASACGDDDDHGTEEGLAEEECPAELSYALIAEPFLEEHCAVCHSEKAAQALGDGNVIDSEASIREHGSHRFELVESGEMPKSGGPVPAAEKKDFLDWLECSGATAAGDGHAHQHTD